MSEHIKKVSFTYALAYQLDDIIKLNVVSDYNHKYLDNCKMDSSTSIQAKKRSIEYIDARDFSSKLKSKVDFINYLEKHRK